MTAAAAGWAEFFNAAAAASAALAGLAIVAISVNVSAILAHRQLPARAAATVGALVVALTVSMAALAPQPLVALGGETLAAGLVGWLLQLWSAARMAAADANSRAPRPQVLLRILLGQSQALPFVAGGAWLLLGRTEGIAVLAFGIVATFVGAALNCWVLLVEILR